MNIYIYKYIYIGSMKVYMLYLVDTSNMIMIKILVKVII